MARDKRKRSAVSRWAPILFWGFIFLLGVEAYAQVSVAVISAEQTARPGDFVTHFFEISNQSPVDETYTLELELPDGLMSLGPLSSTLFVVAGSSETFFATVLVTSDATAGSNEVRLRVIANADPSNQALAVALVNVEPFSSVEVIAPAPLQVVPGMEVVLVFQVANRGNVADSYSLDAGSSRGLPIQLSESRLALLAGESQSVTLTFSIPSTEIAGPETVSLAVDSSMFPNTEAIGAVELVILPPPPEIVGGTLFLEIPLIIELSLLELLSQTDRLVPVEVRGSGVVNTNFDFSFNFGLQDLLTFSSPNADLFINIGLVELGFGKFADILSASVGGPIANFTSITEPEISTTTFEVTPPIEPVLLISNLSLATQSSGKKIFGTETQLAFPFFENLELSIQYSQFNKGFPIARDDVREFISSITYMDDAYASQFLLRYTEENLLNDPTIANFATFMTSLSARADLGVNLPSGLFQFDITRNTGVGPLAITPIDDFSTFMRFQMSLEILESFSASGFFDRLRSIDKVAGSNFETIRGGTDLDLDLGNLSSSFSFTQSVSHDLIANLLIDEFRDIQFEINAIDDFGQFRLLVARRVSTTQIEFLDFRTSFTSEIADFKLSTAFGFSLPENSDPIFSLSFTIERALTFTTGILTKGRLEGFIFVDSNANGVRDEGEAGVSNLIVSVDGVQVLSNGVGSGFYKFPPLPPGEYELDIENLPARFVPGLDLPATVKLTTGVTTTLNIPLIEIGTIEGTVFNDRNRNGVREADEAGIASALILLQGPNGKLFEEISDAFGFYIFPDLLEGNYRLILDTSTLPERFDATTPADLSLVLERGGFARVDFGVAERPQVILFSPTADFMFLPVNPSIQTSVMFDASSSFDIDGTIVAYEWDFNEDGVIDAIGQKVEHRFMSTGNFNVRLTVRDNDGLTGSRMREVVVE